MIRVGINGLGRIGRLALRAGWSNPRLQFVRTNDLSCNPEAAAHLAEFDSLHGRWDATFSHDDNSWTIDDTSLAHTSEADISAVRWSDCDLVIEATGKHHKSPDALAQYFAQGVKKVLVAAPTEGALNIVYGVNHHLYEPAEHNLVTAASCTTNCLAPVVKVMLDHAGIRHGTMTSIHAITNTQTIVDRGHKDLRRARAAGESLIPTTTGSARAITQIFPELTGRLNGHAVRVPTLSASLVDFVFEAERDVTEESVNDALQAAAEGELSGILGFESRPLVSADFVDDPRSAVVDGLSTMVVDQRLVKLYAWYDNEWGYACRVADLAGMIADHLA